MQEGQAKLGNKVLWTAGEGCKRTHQVWVQQKATQTAMMRTTMSGQQATPLKGPGRTSVISLRPQFRFVTAQRVVMVQLCL